MAAPVREAPDESSYRSKGPAPSSFMRTTSVTAPTGTFVSSAAMETTSSPLRTVYVTGMVATLATGS